MTILNPGNLVLDIEALLELVTRFAVYDLRASVLVDLGVHSEERTDLSFVECNSRSLSS
jgi:hypothetical protein